MASIHRRPASKYWHAAFRGPDGRLILRSTKQTDKAKAQVVSLEFERAAKMAVRGDLVEAQARDVLNDIMKRAGSDDAIRAPTVRAFFADWLKTKEARKSPSTHERYASISKKFLECIGPKADRPLTALLATDVDRFLNSRINVGCASRTVILDVKIIRTCLNSARRQGIIPTNVAEAVELPEAAGVERGTFTLAEVRMLVNAANDEWKTLILVAYFTGARLSDCCRLQWTDLDLVKGTLTYAQGKTGTKVTVPLHVELRAQIEALATSDQPQVFVMPHMAQLKPGGRHGLSEGFKRIMRKAGVDSQPVEGNGIRKLSRRTFHALRHSFTSALANAGVAPELRMKLTGHKTAEVHRGYTHHEMKTLSDAVSKIPGLKSDK